jgi:hypothetical protein
MIRNLIVVHGHNHSAPAPSLDVDPTLFSGISYEASFQYVAVDVATEDQAWDCSSDVSWITISGASKLGDDASVRLNVAAQDAGEQPPRTGHVTFTSTDCANVVVTINQQARPA